MHNTPNTDLLTADEPLLEIQIPWSDGCQERDSDTCGPWQPRRTILVSLVVSLLLWTAIAALLF